MLPCTRAIHAATAVLFLVACSAEPRPPELGNCVGQGDASCVPSPLGAGSPAGGASDGSADDQGQGASVCNAGPSPSQCNACAAADCCTPLSVCMPPTTCNTLLACVNDCAGASACIEGCEQRYLDGVTALDAVESCLNLKCPICSESGVGDPCASGYPCIAGESCNGLWCTKACARASDCTGIGPGGGNFAGEPAACLATSGGDLCTPGCSSDADCTDFPGTYCRPTTSVDGLAVSICSALPDGG